MKLGFHFIVFSLLLSACSGVLSDPFAGPPVGKTVSIEPSLKNIMPVSDELNPNKPVSTLLRVGQVADFPANGGSDQSAIKQIASISVFNKDGEKFERLITDLIDSNGASKCAPRRSDIKELLANYNNLVMFCDDAMGLALLKATKLKVKLVNGSEIEFTSWSVNRSDLGGSEFANIYSISI